MSHKNKKKSVAHPSREEINNFCDGDKDAVTAYLAKYGSAFINEKDTDGRTALMNASSSGDEYMMTTLLNKGADVNLKDNKGRTALMEAATNGYTPSVELLLKKKASVNEQDDQGTTPLMEAVISAAGDTDMITVLLDWGADIDIQDKEGATARTLAEEFGYSSTIELLQRWSETQKKNKEQKALEERQEAEKQALKTAAATTETNLQKLRQLSPAKPSLKKKY